MSKKLNNRNIPRSYNNKQFTYNETQFPLLPNQKRHVQLVNHSPSATQFSPNNWNNSANAANNFPRNGSYSFNASQNLHNNKNNNSDLFTMSELTQLSLEMITKLRDCTNKEQQFSVMAELTIKYLYSNFK